MDAKAVKKYLSEEPERIIRSLEYFGFHSFNTFPERVTCALPDGDNDTSVNIYYDSEYLNGIVFTRNSFKSDLFGIIEEFTKYSFKEIINNIKAIFGLSGGKHTKDYSKDILDIGNYNYYLSLKRNQSLHDIENDKYDLSILSSYAPYPHLELIQEGISGAVAKQFVIHTDMQDERMLFPHFDWNEHDKIVGIQGRKLAMDTYTARELGIPKYINYIKGYRKEANLYGWAQNHQNIIDKKEMIIFEGEKSVLKDSTFKRGIGNSVAVGNHYLSPQQIRFIARNTPDDTEIIIAFDKDIYTDSEKRAKLVENIQPLTLIRKVTCLENLNKLLDDKDAPVDKGMKKYGILYDYRMELK